MSTRAQDSFEIISLQNRIDLLQQIHQEDTRRIAELTEEVQKLRAWTSRNDPDARNDRRD